ncbi:1-phosphofructokinase family hexose kinase [Roseomonas sp. M0104]|uniref:Phosphofructokinase n=1 Tax=Teichococcus coralli TaxID=2545983 RepID=A0A845BEX5_9PROT|nr:1-phosphofructokinase family hexose kinase [Pseudoroseomonas coralli]MXP63887.1 1-phosphofructokinase family hexose kinase [Pseudoroseomonas coralli]
MPAEALTRIGTVTLNPAFDLTIPISRLERGEVNRAEGAELRAAGKGVNVSVMLSVLGEPSRAGGLLGAADCAAFEEFLRPLGIISEFEPVPGRCRINVKLVETEAGVVTDINPPGPTVAAPSLAALRRRLVHAPELMVLAGSLPPGLEANAWAELVRSLSGAGRRVLLDTSGPAFKAALETRPHLIKPNRAELADLLGRSLPDRAAVIAAAREVQQRGISHVVVSAGGEGALFALPEAMLWVRPPAVPLTTTVGAGDAMVAGLAAGLARGLDATALARLATGCAAAAVSRPPQGLPTAAEIGRLAEAADVERL